MMKFTPVSINFNIVRRFMKLLSNQMNRYEASLNKENDKEKGADIPRFETFCNTLHSDIIEQMRTPEVKKNVTAFENQTRVLVALNPRTQFDLPEDEGSVAGYCHATLIKHPNKQKMVLTQSCCRKDSPKGKVDTTRKVWDIAWTHKASAIVTLNFIGEDGGSNCPQDGCPLGFEGMKVICTERLDDDYTTICKITITVGDESHQLTHYYLVELYPNLPPSSPKGMLKIWKKVRGLEKVVVQCSDGCNRSAAFAFIEQIYQAAYYSKNQDGAVVFGEELRKLRETRYGALEDRKYFIFAMFTAIECLFEDIMLQTVKKDRKFLKDLLTSIRNDYAAIRARWAREKEGMSWS